MGLDAGFKLRNKETGKYIENFEICYFRKFYALDNWIRTNCQEITEDYEFLITKENIKSLLNELEEVINIFKVFKLRDILDGFDRNLNDVEMSILRIVENNRFCPLNDSNTYYVMQLYFCLNEIYYNINEINRSYDIVYYSSY